MIVPKMSDLQLRSRASNPVIDVIVGTDLKHNYQSEQSRYEVQCILNRF